MRAAASGEFASMDSSPLSSGAYSRAMSRKSAHRWACGYQHAKLPSEHIKNWPLENRMLNCFSHASGGR